MVAAVERLPYAKILSIVGKGLRQFIHIFFQIRREFDSLAFKKRFHERTGRGKVCLSQTNARLSLRVYSCVIYRERGDVPPCNKGSA